MIRNLIFLFLINLALSTRAQDIHFTQWMFAPHTYSPSSIGDFDGKYRFHGNYRNQWSSVTVPFVTFGSMAESNNIDRFENLSLAGGFVYDVTGDSKFSTAHFNLGAGYKVSFGDSIGSLRIGVQPVITQKRIDLEALKFDNQYNGYFFDGTLPTGENLPRLSRWYFDFSAGIQYNYNISSLWELKGSFAAFNLLAPKQSFFNDNNIRLDRRYSFELSSTYQLTPKIMLQPGIQVSKQGKFNAINFGSLVDFNMSKTRFFRQSIFFGVYFRAVDSGDLIVGLNYDQWKAAISYDINYSGLTPASNFKGGIELAVIYIIPYPKKLPQFKFCPEH